MEVWPLPAAFSMAANRQLCNSPAKKADARLLLCGTCIVQTIPFTNIGTLLAQPSRKVHAAKTTHEHGGLNSPSLEHTTNILSHLFSYRQPLLQGFSLFFCCSHPPQGILICHFLAVPALPLLQLSKPLSQFFQLIHEHRGTVNYSPSKNN